MKKYIVPAIFLILIWALCPSIIEKDLNNTILANKLLQSVGVQSNITVYVTEESSQYIPMLNLILIAKEDKNNKLILAHEVAHSLNQYQFIGNFILILVLFWITFRIIKINLIVQIIVLFLFFIPLVSPYFELQADNNAAFLLQRNKIKYEEVEFKSSPLLVTHPKSVDRKNAYSSKRVTLDYNRYSIIEGFKYLYFFYKSV